MLILLLDTHRYLGLAHLLQLLRNLFIRLLRLNTLLALLPRVLFELLAAVLELANLFFLILYLHRLPLYLV